VSIAILTAYFAYDLPKIDKAFEVSRRPMITLLAQNGSQILQIGDLQGVTVYIKDLPKYLTQALIATEDRRFYSHYGIDFVGIFRAVMQNIKASRVVQGGSTISQQAAKNLFLTPDRTFKRKFQELLLAFWLEKKFSKDQILSIYLNRVYLGSGTYGVDAAAKKYFGVPAQNLSIFQAAIIVGLLKAPSRLNPNTNMLAAISRGKIVISNMISAGYLTKLQARKAMQEEIYFVKSQYAMRVGRYFSDWILEQLKGFIGPQSRNVTVKTTLDVKLQNQTEKFLRRYMNNNGKSLNVNQCAVVVMSPDGAVLAMVGGLDYRKSQFNRSTQARRQPGSAFKPIVYLTAMETGLRPGSRFVDSPTLVKGWSPQNYDGKFYGAMPLKQALARSINTIAVKVSEHVGRDKIVKTARRLGITTPLSTSPSLALGAFGVSLIELTGAYAVLANGGKGIWPFGIIEIHDPSGRKLYRRHGGGAGQIVESQYVRLTNDMMREVIQSGTGKKARLDRVAYGKTGTSQGFRDAWFIGYTKEIVAGVWVGNDNESPMKKVTGGGMPTLIWKEIMKKALQNTPSEGKLENNGSKPRNQQKSLWDQLFGRFIFHN